MRLLVLLGSVIMLSSAQPHQMSLEQVCETRATEYQRLEDDAQIIARQYVVSALIVTTIDDGVESYGRYVLKYAQGWQHARRMKSYRAKSESLGCDLW